MLNNELMRAIELQMEQQERLTSKLENKGSKTTEEVVREFYKDLFEWGILLNISGNLSYGFRHVAEGK